MSYIVIARKYRPRAFEDVIGQEGVATTLRNAIATERVGHAYLFAGPRGVGKTSMARIFSMAMNCVDGPTETPCGRCPSCEEIFLGRDIDVMEIDGASNRGIDEVRAIRENAVYSPTRSRFRIFIIDEVHMLTLQAFNALLKTLEEPPGHVKFIFATTKPQNIPDTIRSRCQRFDFRPVPVPRIAGRLAAICRDEGVDFEERVLEAVARRAAGSMRDGQSLLDQLIAVGRGTVNLATLETVLGWVPLEEIRRTVEVFAFGDVAGALKAVETLYDAGRDPAEFLLKLEEYLRDLLLSKAAGGPLPVAAASAATEEDLAAHRDLFERDELLYLVQAVHAARKELSRDTEGRILIETVAVRLATVKDLPPIDQVMEALEPVAREAARPAPGPRPTAGPPAGGGAAAPTVDGPPPDIEAVRNAWPAVVETLKGRHKWASYLADARPLRVTAQGLHLGFPRDREFHRDQISQAKRKEEISLALAQLAGGRLAVVCVTLQEQAGDVFEGVREERRDVGEEPGPRKRDTAPIVRTALNLFKGKIVPDDRED